jgi:heme/copper-type cytochrome/quinol oxidase subunit 4
MSPSRARGQYVQVRPRSEIYVAVATGAGIVLATALLIWLMRPGTAGVAGTGGLFNRQPRITILVVLTLAAIGGVVWYVFTRRRRWRFGQWGTIAIASALIVVIAVVLGIIWPGGIVKHYSTFPSVHTPPTATTPTTGATPTTNAPRTTAATPTTKAR